MLKSCWYILIDAGIICYFAVKVNKSKRLTKTVKSSDRPDEFQSNSLAKI